MSRKFLTACIAVLLTPWAHATDELREGLATAWEVLWHQSGIPTRVVRWENDIQMRMMGIDVERHHKYVTTALREVTAAAGVRLIDVTDQPGATANLTVEVTSDTALEDNEPCRTYLEFRTEKKIDAASIQMRSRDVWRCAYHEAAHLMGLRGHPAGPTVLSYFPTKVDGLLPLDHLMLRAWYSPGMKAGMTPFEALRVLSDELIAGVSDKVAAIQQRDRFFATTVEQMQAYAAGQGDIPAIVRRSGKSTEAGIRYGRSEMSYFLGVAYFEGAVVMADQKQALAWFERAASAGNRGAQSWLAGPGAPGR